MTYADLLRDLKEWTPIQLQQQIIVADPTMSGHFIGPLELAEIDVAEQISFYLRKVGTT